MFKIESYVTPILLSYVDKYVRDFKPADAQVSLWGGGVALHNLVLKADVLQQEMALPFTLVSGRIHELLIQVPWTKIMSEPIIVTIDTIECVLSINRPTTAPEDGPPPDSPNQKSQVMEAPPGYMQALVRRIVSNIAVRVHHLIVKYVQDDIILSLNVKHLAVESAGADWEPCFADIEPSQPVIRRLVRLDDLTVCLDRADADGKIRFYQEPLLYRCQLDLRVLTRLVSANTRRASNLSIQLRSAKLAWSVTSDQLTLLLRLYRERPAEGVEPPVALPKVPTQGYVNQATQPIHSTSSNSAEPARSGSWSEWAWSWLPTSMDRVGPDQPPACPAPLPVHFAAYLDDVSVVFKVMELEGGSRKRPRVVLELVASHTAVKSYSIAPVSARVRLGARKLRLLSRGKCVCGFLTYSAFCEEPETYLCKPDDYATEEWVWPDEQLEGVEIAKAVDEHYRTTPELGPQESFPDPGQPEEPVPEERRDGDDAFWQSLAPQLYLEFRRERAPPLATTNPYDSPPDDFQYSDWSEECDVKIVMEPTEVEVSMGLVHRLAALRAICQELPPVHVPDIPMRILTVEECDSLTENLPERRVSFEARGLVVRVVPWDHAGGERPAPPPAALLLDLPKTSIVLNGPLYPHRVCSAACQMPDDSGTLWQGARLHVTVSARGACARLSAPPALRAPPRPVARIDLRAVAHLLLHHELFSERESVIFGYSLNIREANVCGSSARLQAAWQVASSLCDRKASVALRHTSLAADALNDEEAVAIDVTIEDLILRGYVTGNTNTHIVSFQSAKATALHEPKGESLKQAWFFSAPDVPIATPYLRLAVQWCENALPHSLDYVGIWTEPTAVCVDPLFIAWLAYKPTLKPIDSLPRETSSKLALSTQYFMKKRTTPPSSSGRGASKSSAEQVHVKPRSAGSSDKADSRDHKQTSLQSGPAPWWHGDRLLALHARLRWTLVSVELGLTLVYVTMSTASAVDCGTIRDAMELHASTQCVLVLSLGRLSIFSSSISKHFWHTIKPDGPTFMKVNPEEDARPESLPWKLCLADVSCYTLEVRAGPDRSGKDKTATALRSQLKASLVATPRTVLELVTTSVTLSVVTKALQVRVPPKRDSRHHSEPDPVGERMKYFSKGVDFKPTTLKEFVRGPSKRKKESPEKKPEPPPPPETVAGPVVSLGVHLHADTPPIIVRLEHDQVHIVMSAMHCFSHIAALLKRPPPSSPRPTYTTLGGSHRSLIRSVSEAEELQTQSDETQSNRSELISIFEAKSALNSTVELKTFFWFQWVVSRVTLVASTNQVKLAFDVDDIIATVDLQNHYNQLKVKVASASVRHYERSGSDEWKVGVLGGRVLELREPTNICEDNHFLTVTVTQALISNLPPSWKEELHPKLLEHKNSTDSMWEIYATMAPLEMVLQPDIMQQIVSLVHEMAPRSYCPLQKEPSERLSFWQWPYCYVSCGGLRLLLTQEQQIKDNDDTFMFLIGKVTVSPHPDNPICRRAMNVVNEASWTSPGAQLEGRQYEVLVRNVGVSTAQFIQLVNQETSEAEITKAGTVGENPALKWTQPVFSPKITPVLHAVDVGCVLAPAMFVAGALTCGPAVELNLVTDCAVELSLDQLVLTQRVLADVLAALAPCEDSEPMFDFETHGVCPYALIFVDEEENQITHDISGASLDEEMCETSDLGRSRAESGADASTSSARAGPPEGASVAHKKSVSILGIDKTGTEDASDYLEVYVTMGVIEMSLYVADDGSPEVVRLYPPRHWEPAAAEHRPQQEPPAAAESSNNTDRRDDASSGSSKSLMASVRNTDVGQTQLEMPTILQRARRIEGNIPLVHMTLSQPNLYYWRKKTQKTLQVSIFNAWLGLGAGELPGAWHASLASTAGGARDPLTDIPPALITLKLQTGAPGGGGASRGSVRVDVERPVVCNVCADSLLRLRRIADLIKIKALPLQSTEDLAPFPMDAHPALYRLKKLLVRHSIESVTVATSQMAVCGSEGVAGWDSLSLQVAAGSRPERVVARALLSAAVVSVGPAGDARHVLLHPLIIGMELEASWEAWRRAEGGLSAREPAVRACLDLDQVTLDLRTVDLAAFARLRDAYLIVADHGPEYPSSSSESISVGEVPAPSSVTFERHFSSEGPEDHLYKDDLRSGAFKIISGSQLPMAYQVTLHDNAVSWRYPHPRAITKLVAFPLPDQETETQCILELYNPQLLRWEGHTHFHIPVDEPLEMQLYVAPPDTTFAAMWRYRLREADEPPAPFEFLGSRFMPRPDPLSYCAGCEPPPPPPPPGGGVSAEQLSAAVRVDSRFSPRTAPRLCLALRLATCLLHLHNDLPNITSQATSLEGYYVSKPLMRRHRVLTLAVRDASVNASLASPAGALLLFHTYLSCDIVECATGTMEQLVEEFRLQAGLSLPAGAGGEAARRARVAASRVHAALHVARLRTLHSLATDWKAAVEQHIRNKPRAARDDEPVKRRREVADVTAAALEGRVSLWIHNGCASALRVGQEGTEEVVPLAPGTRLAYRWRSPIAAKKLRFSVAGPTADWHWSTSIPFKTGSHCVRLADAEPASKGSLVGGVFLYTRVEELGSRRTLMLTGRLCPANMLRDNLLYKIRIRAEGNQWRTIGSGEMQAESVGNSVICSDLEMALKIKFTGHEAGWSGDIPLKECPKQNVPWLVKVPSDGEEQYRGVWCRVVRARNDGRLVAAVWPLYVLYSHLPLDTDVLIQSDTVSASSSEAKPRVHQTPGRGTCSHLLAPGTTAARHSLSFQYRDMECPVTREAIPLHYGVTDTSVFDKRAPVASLDDVLAEIHLWLKRSGRGSSSSWPYSVVAAHWPGQWSPAVLQPRCDVTVRYQAVRAGGGCSLEVQLCPVVLLCNATPISLTLRAHDAAPLCKLEPGTAISPPSAVLKKPFFISVEMGRETFVSDELSLSGAELGRYGTPPRGRLALDHAAELAVQCNHKVALLSMFYEVKEDINVLGVTSTYMLINRMKTEILVSAIAVPNQMSEDTVLSPSMYKVIEPTPERSMFGIPLCRFYVAGRWRGSDPTDLRLYLCVRGRGIGAGGVPIRLARPPLRRAASVLQWDNSSVPIVITQIKSEGRWVVTVSEDPCPQMVIHNRTRTALSVAQPVAGSDVGLLNDIAVVPECAGTAWRCVLQPGSVSHYSTPAHCDRYPPLTASADTHHAPFLTFAKVREEGVWSWCAPLAVADGARLLQLCGVTVKLRVRTHPHSTYLELRDVDQNDISASDIRKRLYGAFSSEHVMDTLTHHDGQLAATKLERIGGEEKLFSAAGVLEPGAVSPSPREAAGTPLPTETSATNLADEAGPSGAAVSVTVAADKGSASRSALRVFNDPPPLVDPLADPKGPQGGSVPSTVMLYVDNGPSVDFEKPSRDLRMDSDDSAGSLFRDVTDPEWEETESWASCDRLRVVAAGVAVELAAAADARPLLALHLDRAALLLRADARRTKTTISIADVQVDNLQFESGQFDFAVLATTRGAPPTAAASAARWPPLWNPFGDEDAFAARQSQARALLRLTHDTWAVHRYQYTELTEVEVRIGLLALYVEDAYVKALEALVRAAAPGELPCPMREEAALRGPLRLRRLRVHPLDLTLTLHTAVRMYIALDQSPLRLSAFKMQDLMTSSERLTHALTVHYLSAAILGAGWVVGGLELLGAPGALAARVGGATGGVRGVASAAAAALVRSLSAWAGSLARNLDMLAGDEEHARRAAAARRRPPPSLLAGLATGISNFAVNLLGAVGGLAHHPLVGVAVGETESGATALRRGLIGAFAKPLSATADLVAFAGHGLLTQTGWDPVPQPRSVWCEWRGDRSGWRRDCVRWSFRLAELDALAGFHVLLDAAPLLLLLTHKFLVVADPESERIVEMIDLRCCSIGPYQGHIIELSVTQKRQLRVIETRGDEDDEYQISAAAMARVARYTGATAGGGGGEARVLSLVPGACNAPALHAALLAAVHHNSPHHLSLL